MSPQSFRITVDTSISGKYLLNLIVKTHSSTSTVVMPMNVTVLEPKIEAPINFAPFFKNPPPKNVTYLIDVIDEPVLEYPIYLS